MLRRPNYRTALPTGSVAVGPTDRAYRPEEPRPTEDRSTKEKILAFEGVH